MPFPTPLAHLYICLQSNVNVLPREFCNINIWIVIAPSNRVPALVCVNTVLLRRVRSWVNRQMHFEAKQITTNTLAPKTRRQHTKRLAQISSVKLTSELFSCGSSLVEMQHMLSISMMWWMQSAQKCKAREAHVWFYMVSSQKTPLIFFPSSYIPVIFKGA